MHALLLLLGSYIGNTAGIVENSYMGKTPKLPMAKGKPARRLSMAPKFSVVNAIEEIIVIIIIIIILIIILIFLFYFFIVCIFINTISFYIPDPDHSRIFSRTFRNNEQKTLANDLQYFSSAVELEH